MVQDTPVLNVTYLNNILQSFSSNVDVGINNQQIHNSDGLYAHKLNLPNNFNGVISELKRVLNYDGYDYEQSPDDIVDAPLSESFLQGEGICLVDVNVPD